jgi:HAD superfamily hydrolase (TIGR01459 family)
MRNSSSPAGVAGLSEIAGDYPFILCDVWGVIHNGVHAYRAAAEALSRYRGKGGRVLLITNAPRPKHVVVGQLDRFGVDRDAYDDIITSGDVARNFLAARPEARVFHLGPERDLPIYEGLPITLVGKDDADLISCTGLFDDTSETPDDYDDSLSRFIARGLPMLCANPDKVVERGDQLVWCAGALADRYEALGGETIVIGKPHAPIYAAALRRLGEIAGREIAKESVLAIGDGVGTDLRGAFDQSIDVLFVTDGIHAGELGPRDAPAEAAVHRFLAAAGLGARNFIARLTW